MSTKTLKTSQTTEENDASITVTELFERIKAKFVEQLRKNEIKLKVGDIVKIIELQKKLTEDSGAEDKFWEMIEQIRQKELKDE